MKLSKLYVFDTNVISQLIKSYPQVAFPDLLPSIEQLITDGTIVSPHEVLRELERWNTKEVLEWAKDHAMLFKDIDDAQIKATRVVMSRYKDHSVHDKPTAWADPLVISLAMCVDGTAVTMEKIDGKKPKVPLICEELGVECVSLFEFFEEIGWTFTLRRKA